MKIKTTIEVGDRITIVHPLDNYERYGNVEFIGYLHERDDIRIIIPDFGVVILSVVPGTKLKRKNQNDDN